MNDVEKWKELIKEGKQNEAGEIKRKIFETTKERFRKIDRGNWDIEILTVGNTPEPLILSILALKPKECVFICTQQSRKTLDRVIKECSLEPNNVFSETIESKANGEDVYNVIQKYYKKYIKEKRIAVDITGGTKAMVGGAASAASFLHLPIFYVKAIQDRIGNMNYEVPGSEELIELKNPFEFFRSDEETIGMALFDAHAYRDSTEILGKCIGVVRDPSKTKDFEIKKDIANGYFEWDKFNYEEAEKSIGKALKSIKQFGIHKKGEEVLEKQKNALEKLVNGLNNRLFPEVLKDKDVAFLLIVDMFLNAERRYEQGQFGDGILRLYRTLEFITQFELVKYGISPENVSKDVKEKYESAFVEKSKIVYGGEKKIPKELSLMDSAILLLCLKEEGKKCVLWGPMSFTDELSDLKQKLWPRNKAITVHGIEVSSEKNYKDMKEFVYPFIEKLVGQELINLQEVLRHRKSSELFD